MAVTSPAQFELFQLFGGAMSHFLQALTWLTQATQSAGIVWTDDAGNQYALSSLNTPLEVRQQMAADVGAFLNAVALMEKPPLD